MITSMTSLWQNDFYFDEVLHQITASFCCALTLSLQATCQHIRQLKNTGLKSAQCGSVQLQYHLRPPEGLFGSNTNRAVESVLYQCWTNPHCVGFYWVPVFNRTEEIISSLTTAVRTSECSTPTHLNVTLHGESCLTYGTWTPHLHW